MVISNEEFRDDGDDEDDDNNQINVKNVKKIIIGLIMTMR